MWWYVYRQRSDDSIEEVGRTKYEADAYVLFSRWHSSYISHRGMIVAKKNMKLEGV